MWIRLRPPSPLVSGTVVGPRVDELAPRRRERLRQHAQLGEHQGADLSVVGPAHHEELLARDPGYRELATAYENDAREREEDR